MKFLIVFLFLIASNSIDSQITFSYTGALQTYTVPLGVFEITVDMVGAGAGESVGLAVINTPGAGGRVETTLTVAPGDVLNLYVGGEGPDGVEGFVTAGGWNGGGDSGGAFGLYAGGGGGGASDIRNGGVALTDRVVVAGGGGGPATNTFAGGDDGGDGGGLIADDGVSGDLLPTVFGYGGTQVTGGAFGFFAPYIAGIVGVLGDGGHAGSNSAGGGGGGGYYGGGGGCWGGGGGGSNFVDAGVTSGTTHTIGFNTGDGEITLTPISILPIEVNKFIASLNDKDNVELSWTTLSESDNDYFKIEKSISGFDNWKTVTIEKGAGNSSNRIDYFVLDENPNQGISYYRLKQIDFNGDSKVFDPVLIDFSTNGNSFIYPNPAVNNIKLRLDSKNVDLKDIKIFNLLGQDITNRINIHSIENNQFTLDLSNLSEGSYFIKTPFESIKFSKIQ